MSHQEALSPKDELKRPTVKAHLRAYAERSSIKCLPKLMRAKSTYHKLLWLATFVFGGTAASYLLYGLLSIYTSYEKTLSVAVEEGVKPPFPDVTVCNLNPLWHNRPGWGLLANIEGMDELLSYDQYIWTLFHIFHLSDYENNSTLDADNLELFSASGYLKHVEYDRTILENLTDILIEKCIWETDSRQRSCLITPVITPANGLCYTIRPPLGEGTAVKTRQEGLAVILFLNNMNLRFVADYRLSPFRSYTQGVKVLLHPSGTVPQMAKGFTVSAGTEASVVARYRRRSLLTAPYGHCKNDVSLNSENIKEADQIWSYSEDACRSLCYQDKIIEKCGCLDSTELTYDKLVGQYPFCAQLKPSNIQQTLADINCTRSVKSELDERNVCTAQCPLPCLKEMFETNINQVSWPQEVYLLGFYYYILRDEPLPEDFRYYYETAIKYASAQNVTPAWQMIQSTNFIQENYLQLSITMDDSVLEEKDKPAITIETLLGSIGGILNLWIGFTFITIMEFVELLITIVTDRFSTIKVSSESTTPDNKHKSKVTLVEPFRS